jgi:hypothetical protein
VAGSGFTAIGAKLTPVNLPLAAGKNLRREFVIAKSQIPTEICLLFARAVEGRNTSTDQTLTPFGGFMHCTKEDIY